MGVIICEEMPKKHCDDAPTGEQWEREKHSTPTPRCEKYGIHKRDDHHSEQNVFLHGPFTGKGVPHPGTGTGGAGNWSPVAPTAPLANALLLVEGR